MSRAWRNRWIAFGASTFVMWVVTNVVIVTFVPIVHRVTVAVRVVDAVSRQPIESALVAWTAESAGAAARRATSREGTVVLCEAIQQQPLWFLPLVGWLAADGRSLVIDADGYVKARVDLDESFSGVSLANPVARVEVALRRP